MDLTKKQEKILLFIKEFIVDSGYPPSVRDIAAHFNLASAGGVHKHLKNLEEKGFIAQDPNISRSIRILNDISPSAAEDAGPVVSLPLKGKIAAGQPLQYQLEGESMSFPDFMVRRPEKSYVLEVSGSSMIEESILDGDFIIVEEKEYADNGEMVVAMVDYESATLKRFFKEGAQVRLQPSNFDMEPIYVDASRVTVHGIVKGVFRQY
ncbi:MAG: transcriptional repressor LexA [SAR324 cluster bacterium]|nr:transcriptional repressor LexA [SAR324 cluster bacterium]